MMTALKTELFMDIISHVFIYSVRLVVPAILSTQYNKEIFNVANIRDWSKIE